MLVLVLGGGGGEPVGGGGFVIPLCQKGFGYNSVGSCAITPCPCPCPYAHASICTVSASMHPPLRAHTRTGLVCACCGPSRGDTFDGLIAEVNEVKRKRIKMAADNEDDAYVFRFARAEATFVTTDVRHSLRIPPRRC